MSLNQLVFYSKFNEESALQGSAIASAVSGLAGILGLGGSGNNASVVGVEGKALGFDGVDDMLTFADGAGTTDRDFASGAALTLSVWVKPTTVPGGSMSWTILRRGDNINSINYELRIGNDTAAQEQRLAFYYYDGGGFHIFTSSTNVFTVVNTWVHVAFTYTVSTAGSAQLYVNGSSIGGSWTSGTGSAAPVIADHPLAVGGGQATKFFTGTIDEVSVWKRILTAGEISTIALRQTP